MTVEDQLPPLLRTGTTVELWQFVLLLRGCPFLSSIFHLFLTYIDRHLAVVKYRAVTKYTVLLTWFTVYDFGGPSTM